MNYTIGELFKEQFNEAIEKQEPIGMVIQFASSRLNPSINKFIFVEGRSDETFYSNTNIRILKNNTKYFWQYSNKDKVENLVGKEGVYVAYKQILEDQNLSKDLNKCLFIVDRDWDFELKSKNFQMNYKDRNFFSITLGHSMENYFLEKENIKILFNKLSISNKSKKYFEIMFTKFVYETADFFALKGAIVYAYNNHIKFDYRKEYDFTKIFDFSFLNETTFNYNRSGMKYEINKMKMGIKKSDKLMIIYDELYDLIIEKQRMIRGHDAFNFLKEYLYQIHDIQIKIHCSDKLLLSEINEFDIRLNINEKV